MKYRKFGKTGLEISELAFGCGQVGGLLINGSDEDRRLGVRKALDAGINWFDTAAQYGNGKSEEALGWLLEEIPETPYVSTKVRVDPAAPDIAGQIEANVQASLRRLRREQVDLLQLHNTIEPSAGGRAVSTEMVLGAGGVADTFERLKEQGLTRFIGISGFGDTTEMIRVIRTGRFDTAQIYYNLLNPSAARSMPPAWSGQNFEGMLRAAKESGAGVLAVRILAGGRVSATPGSENVSILTKDTDPGAEGRNADAVFRALGDEYGDRAQTGVRFALSHPDISCAVVGVGATDHVDAAVAAAELGPLPPAALDKLDALYASGFAD